MHTQPTTANIVILAEKHNPSIPSRDWLWGQGVMSEEAVNFVHLPVLSQYESESFLLTVDESRWRLDARKLSAYSLDQMGGIAVKYVERLPHTVYKAIGFNFEWVVHEESANWIALTRQTFLANRGSLTFPGVSEDLVISPTLQWDSGPFLVTVVVMPNRERSHELSVRLNYHRDLPPGEERLKDLCTTASHFLGMYEASGKAAGALGGAILDFDDNGKCPAK